MTHKEHKETPAMESKMHSKKFLAAALRKEISGAPSFNAKDQKSKDGDG